MAAVYLAILTLIPLIFSFYYYHDWPQKIYSKLTDHQSVAQDIAVPSPSPIAIKYFQPVDNYLKRITKKPFGIYVTPKNSPIKPERFTGFHTGADAEYEDVESTVAVHAIAPGTVIYSAWTKGYGGLIAISHNYQNQQFISLYGHLLASSMPPINTNVVGGQTIGILGKGNTVETDGERRHLHLAILKGTALNVKGYVQAKSDLNQWIDPATLLK